MSRRVTAALVALAATLAVLAGSAHASVPVRHHSVVTSGVDLHDGMVLQQGTTYYRYGTIYTCSLGAYQWSVAGTPWCGFGVSTASSLAGPWSAPVALFPPTSTDPYRGTSWQTVCGSTGAGCFNPRMVINRHGVPVLWFNSPQDYVQDASNAYNAMGCNSLAGPCGPTAGAPNGSYLKPSLSHCWGNGDFAFIASAVAGAAPAMVCTMPGGGSLSLDELNEWGNEGSGVGASVIGGIHSIEAPGGWYDAATATYYLTYSDPYCGYCSGTGTGYATATSLYGPWTAPVDVTASPGAAPVNGSRLVSGISCGGQPRDVQVLDGTPMEWVDLWRGTRNESLAGVDLVPLVVQSGSGSPGDGGVRTLPLAMAC